MADAEHGNTATRLARGRELRGMLGCDAFPIPEGHSRIGLLPSSLSGAAPTPLWIARSMDSVWVSFATRVDMRAPLIASVLSSSSPSGSKWMVGVLVVTARACGSQRAH